MVLTDEEIAARVASHHVRAVELTRHVPVAAKCADDLERLTIEDVNQLVGAVVDVDELLLRIS